MLIDPHVEALLQGCGQAARARAARRCEAKALDVDGVAQRMFAQAALLATDRAAAIRGSHEDCARRPVVDALGDLAHDPLQLQQPLAKRLHDTRGRLEAQRGATELA